MKDRILTLVIFIASVIALTGQSIVGDWEGNLDVQGSSLKVIFHVAEDAGSYTASMDSPNQGAFDIKMDETTYSNETLIIKNKQMGMETVASYDAGSDMIEGSFNQGPMKLPLKLTRVPVKEEASSNHPMAGDWNSELDAMGMQLRLVFHIQESEGTFSTTMDSPDQGAFGIPIDETIVDGKNISFTAKSMGMNVEGTYIADSNIIKAKFRQGPLNEEIVLSKKEIAKRELLRPQEPSTFDYTVEDVEFTNPEGGHSLSGTLTLPKSGNFDKAVVLVSGSGPQDRNEELLGHKPFLVLSDHLTKNNIAVLRYDDRGVGASKGDFASSTSMDFAMDATAAVDYLRSRTETKDKLIGVMGHSEGGLIAPIVAQKTNLDFTVLLAGPGIDSDVLLLEQTKAITEASGEDKDEIEFSQKSARMMFDYMNENYEMDTEELIVGMKDLLRKRFSLLNEEDLHEIGDVEAEINQQVKPLTTPWFRYFMNFEPSKYLSKLTIPVLAVNGSLDLQVLPKSNLKGIKDNLEIAGNKSYTIKEFEGLNHLFQVSKDGSGAPSEYGSLEETFNEDAMTYITTWISKL